MPSAGPIAQFCIPIGLFLAGLALPAAVLLKLLGIAPIRGPLFSFRDFPANPYGLAFRWLAYSAVPALILLVIGGLAWMVGI